MRLVGGQLCCVGSRAIWKMENREAEREKKTEKKSHLNVRLKSAEEIQTLLHDPVLLRTPEFGNKVKTKNGE